ARARPRGGVPIPRRARRRARLSARPGRQRVPGDDRPRAVQRVCADRCRFRQTAVGEYSPRVRCGLACTLALLILAPAAAGDSPAVSVQATPLVGAAPLHVTFAGTGEATSFHWDFGDGSSADGRTAEHSYAAGRWTATLTASSPSGEPTTQSVQITAYGLTLAGPNPARYAR